MNWVKCVPFFGTGVSAGECIRAVVDGDGKKALWKLGETLVDGTLDVATVASGGLAAMATAPGKAAGKAIVGATVKALAGRAFVGAVVDNVVNSQSTPSLGGVGGGGGDKEQGGRKKKTEHEEDLPVSEQNNPIVDYTLGRNGRTQTLTAKIFPHHLRDPESTEVRYTTRVKKHVDSLGKCSVPLSWGEANDHVGHIVAWILGGPSDSTHNFFAQSPYCNSQFWHEMEKEIYNYLRDAGPREWVWIHFEFIFGEDSDRPIGVKIAREFSDGKMDDLTFSNK